MEVERQYPSLDEDLVELIRDLASSPVAVEAVSGRSRRPSYRLTLADGRVLKAKCLRDAAHAARVAQILEALRHPALPQVSQRRGAAIVTRWVPGRVLRVDETDLGLVRECGAVQGFIHARPAMDRAIGTGWQPADARPARLRRDLDDLVCAGRLEREVATAATDVATRYAPRGWTVGIVHGDLNAENIVCGETGEIGVVDNETLSIGACPYDLARTWYRWPMGAAQWAVYREGYRQHASDTEFEMHLPYWGVAVLVRGAAFRLRTGLDGIDEPLVRLRDSLRAWH